MAFNPLYVVVPAAGAGLLYLLFRPRETPAALRPPALGPAAAAGVSGGSRYLVYMQRLDAAVAGWRILPQEARAVARDAALGTIDVVGTMAADDAAQGNVTAADAAAIGRKVEALRAEVRAG